MSSVLRERFSNKESIPYETSPNSARMSDLPEGNQESNKSFDQEQDVKPAKENQLLLILAVHFCNVLYSSCYWINVGIYPVWENTILTY